jgi:hypothetical protein
LKGKGKMESAGQREVPMIRAKQILTEKIETIGKLVDETCNRLEQLCSPQPPISPAPTENKTPEKVKPSPAVEDIEIFASRIQNITARLQDIYRRLEI